jgi:hypothetical protein
MCELLACDPKALWAIARLPKLHCADGLVQDWVCTLLNTTAAAEAFDDGRAHFGAMSELQLLRQLQLFAWVPPLLLYWLEQRA